MPKKIRDYLLKMKSRGTGTGTRPQIRLPSKNWILSGCKHPRTPSFALYSGRNQVDDQKDRDAATLADVDRFLFENFKSLYLKDDHHVTENTKRELVLEDDQSQEQEETPPHLRGCTRFFVKPEDALTSDEAGSSSVSTINDVSSSNSYEKDRALPDDSIALLTHSNSPYDDFMRSMQQMVNNHETVSVVDWDFMEDLLFSYLNLNHKKSHKFILTAFVDLVNLMRQSPSDKPLPRSVRTLTTKHLS